MFKNNEIFVGQFAYRWLFFSYLSTGKRAEAKPCKYINECTSNSKGIGHEHLFSNGGEWHVANVAKPVAWCFNQTSTQPEITS